MRSPHPPRSVLIVLILVVGAVFLSGTLLAFSGAQAAQAPTATPPPPDLTPTPTPVALPTSTDTTGVIALSIVVVIVIIAGILWGERRPARPAKTRK